MALGRVVLLHGPAARDRRGRHRFDRLGAGLLRRAVRAYSDPAAIPWHLRPGALNRPRTRNPLDRRELALLGQLAKAGLQARRLLTGEARAHHRGKLIGYGNAAALFGGTPGWRLARRVEVSAQHQDRRAARRNPHLLTISNPSVPPAALRAFRRFHGRRVPLKLRRVKGPASPRVLVELGAARSVVYQPGHGERRGPAFEHRFGPGVKLAADPAGRNLLFVHTPASRMRVDWRRGILR